MAQHARIASKSKRVLLDYAHRHVCVMFPAVGSKSGCVSSYSMAGQHARITEPRIVIQMSTCLLLSRIKKAVAFHSYHYRGWVDAN